jgi:PKD repeat protein
MKRRLLPFLVVLTVLTSGLPLTWGAHSFESMPYSDELGDGVDFNLCFIMDTIAPMPIPMDVESVTLVPAEELDSGDVTLNVEVQLNAPPLPHQSYTIEIGIDVDMDPTTGASSPGCFYNGLGVDYDVGVEVSEGSVASVWMDRYEAGAWVTVAEPTADIVERTVIVGFPVDTLGSPLNSGLTVYLITEGGLDMAPGYGDPPITFTFHYIPEPYFEAPETVNEGTSYELDASASSSRNGAISLYEWDLDGDGVYEEGRPDPVASFQFADNGVYSVGLRVTDEAGFSSAYNKEITVLNTPPFNVGFSHAGELKAGEELAFTGQAEDLGEDLLTYSWDFGDGETAEGAEATHAYADAGDYNVVLTVTDDDGGSSTSETDVLIEASTPPPEPLHILGIGTRLTVDEPLEGDEVAFVVTLEGEGDIMSPGSLKLYVDDADMESAPFWETDVTLSPGVNEFTSTAWLSEAGDHIVSWTVEGVEGEPGAVTGALEFNVGSGGDGGGGLDPLLVILVALFGLGGFLIYDYIRRGKKDEEKKEEEEEEEKDFCEEHPEVVEEENKKCEDAMWKLDDALGPIEDDLAAAKDQWREDMREVGRLIMEWDIAYAVIQSLTKSEEEIRKEAEKVQQVAAIVKPGASMGKTAFKKGGEEAMKEMGKHIATEVGKGIASEVSQTVSDLLSLEGWAMSEIGIGIAKLITGIDPKQEASDIRKESMRTCTLLQSWVDHNLARTERFTYRTLHTCIDEAQKLIDRINDALKAFEDAVADFKCVTCELTPEYMEHIQGMINELNDFMKAFGDLIDQVEQRLNQAVALYNREDVYDSPYVRVNVQNNKVPNIKKSLERSAEAKK